MTGRVSDPDHFELVIKMFSFFEIVKHASFYLMEHPIHRPVITFQILDSVLCS
jgi:hypothetical protein